MFLSGHHLVPFDEGFLGFLGEFATVKSIQRVMGGRVRVEVRNDRRNT